ncbi:MAG: sporulation initiation factor Spo0A C-terminal domain-containing protein [Bariatricus sp.]
MELAVCKVLHNLGMIPKYTGYKYFVEAVLIGLEKEGSLEHITKDVYPEIAGRHQVSVWMVESNIRSMIERCWNNSDSEWLIKYYPDLEEKKRPTNTQLIEGIVTYIREHKENDTTE